MFDARANERLVDIDDFERAKDKIIMGAERRSMVMPEEERRNTAYHESGHTVVAKLLPKTDPVHKVTIIPRGRALGVTMQLPEVDRYSQDRDRLLNTIAVLFGGRIAEEIFMQQMTTGAANDFERATDLARRMEPRAATPARTTWTPKRPRSARAGSRWGRSWRTSTRGWNRRSRRGCAKQWGQVPCRKPFPPRCRPPALSLSPLLRAGLPRGCCRC